jgi:HK97 family phage major capsid protein
MPLNAEDVQSWDVPKLEKELKARLDDVQSLRDKNGGTLVGLKGPDADKVREHMADTNLLGEQMDERREQETADTSFNRLSEYLNEPDPERAVAHGKNGKPKAQTRDIGGLFLESEAFKAFRENGTLDKEANLPLESLWPKYQGIGEVPSMQAALFQSSDYPVQPEFIPTPVETLYQANNIGPLFAQGTTSSNAIRYVTETVTATGAAETAEGATKPEAQISFSSTDEPVRKIAVLLPLNDESLEDIPLLRAYINARLRLFVQMREDSQLLNGNGTTPNLKGILNRSGINTATSYSIGGSNPDQALVDAVFHAAMRVRDAFLEPDAAVMKPSTWEIAALAKDGNRNYLLGGPGAAGYAGNDQASGPRLWGLRVVLNANMPAQATNNKDVLVGAFQTSAMLVRKGGITLAVSDSHSTFFAENKVMLRAEERLALALWRPAGFATVTSAA